MVWRITNITLAILAALTGAFTVYSGSLFAAMCCFGCAVVFTLLSLNVPVLGFTRRALEWRKKDNEGK